MAEQKSDSDLKLPFSGTLDDVESKIEGGKHYYQQGKVKELKLKYEEANEAFKQAVNCHPDNIEYLNAAGLSGSKVADYEQAEQFLRKSLEFTIGKFGEDHPDTATCYSNLASNLYAQGKLEEAEALYSNGLDHLSI